MTEIPPRIRRLLDDAEGEHARYEEQLDGKWDPFIVSDFEAVWSRISAIPECRGTFLEWGSGMGAITLMAAYLGFDAYGIEINRQLVDVAERMAHRHQLAATFACGSFYPDGFEDESELLDPDLYHDSSGANGYRLLGLSLADVDFVFAFPPPGEEELFLDLFRRGASPHARMLCNFGSDGLSWIDNR